jgi:uncharacterized protein
MIEKKLKCLWVHSGNAGDINTCKGIMKNLDVVSKILDIKNINKLEDLRNELNTFSPDLFLATGKDSAPLAKKIKQISPNIYTVFLKDPRKYHVYYDLIWTPVHDDINYNNNFSTITTPHNASIDETYFSPNDTDKKKLGVLIGGKNSHYKFGSSEIKKLCSDLNDLSDKYNLKLIITCSKRTGLKNQIYIQKYFMHSEHWVWRGKTQNPFNKILGHSDYFLVTADSINMISELCITGKPIFVYKLPNFIHRFFGKSKFEEFYTKLIDLNIIRWFDGVIHDWSYNPIDNTQYVSEKILEEYSKYLRNN